MTESGIGRYGSVFCFCDELVSGFCDERNWCGGRICDGTLDEGMATCFFYRTLFCDVFGLYGFVDLKFKTERTDKWHL